MSSKASTVIQGERVFLKHPRRGELGFIRQLWSDPDTMKAVGGPIDLEERQAKEWFAQMVDPGSESDCYFLIYLKSEKPIGEVSYHRWDSENRCADLNIKTHAVYRGHGYASEALRLFLTFYFQNTQANSLIDEVALGNRPAQRLLEKFGFRHDPSRSDCIRMILQREGFAPPSETLYE